MQSQPETAPNAVNVEEHYDKVVWCAKRLKRVYRLRMPVPELTNVGFVALLKLAPEFDPSRAKATSQPVDHPKAFWAFVSDRVEGAMIDEAAKTGDRRATGRSRMLIQAHRAAAEAALPVSDQTIPRESWDEIVAGLATHQAAYALQVRAQQQVARDALSPEELLLRREKDDRVAAAVDSLPVREAQMIRQRFFEDLSVNQIAENFRIDPSNASHIIRNALERMRKRIAADDP